MVQFRLLSKGLNKLLCVKNGKEEEIVNNVENENKLTALKLQLLLNKNRKKK